MISPRDPGPPRGSEHTLLELYGAFQQGREDARDSAVGRVDPPYQVRPRHHAEVVGAPCDEPLRLHDVTAGVAHATGRG